MIGPTTVEERAIALRRRLKLKGEHLKTKWISSGPVLWVVFFLLTLQGASAGGIFFMFFGRNAGLVIGPLFIILAEVLIWRFRFFSTGVESALYLMGISAIIFGISVTTEEVLIAIALALGIAGWRLRNAWFGAAAVVVALIYGGLEVGWASLVVAAAIISLAALVALKVEVQRPSTEWFFIASALFALTTGVTMTFAAERALWPLWLAYAVVAGGLWLRLRHHAAFLCALGGSLPVIVEAHRSVPLPTETQLILAGSVLVGIAASIMRSLRDRRRGIVVMPGSFTSYDEVVESAATTTLAPEPVPSEKQQGGGGSFGGAGATGQF